MSFLISGALGSVNGDNQITRYKNRTDHESATLAYRPLARKARSG